MTDLFAMTDQQYNEYVDEYIDNNYETIKWDLIERYPNQVAKYAVNTFVPYGSTSVLYDEDYEIPEHLIRGHAETMIEEQQA